MKKRKPPKQNKEDTTEIKIKVIFEFIIHQNAQNVALALCSAGYYVRMTSSGNGYILYVYTDRF